MSNAYFIKGNESDADVAEAPALDISDSLTIKISFFFFFPFALISQTSLVPKRKEKENHK